MMNLLLLWRKIWILQLIFSLLVISFIYYWYTETHSSRGWFVFPVQGKSPWSSDHDRYASRRQKCVAVCSDIRASDRDSVHRLVDLDEWNTTYCAIPKVGSTFWISVFRWMINDTNGAHYQSPFDIPRYEVHSHPTLLKLYRFNVKDAPSFLSDRFRFMFVRDPYSRLWSAYLDKFYLPDLWREAGWTITSRRQGATILKDKCGNDISFPEFLDYVTNSSDSKTMNEHYRPYFDLCSPCFFRPHVIGKLETFERDTRYLLGRMNASWLAEIIGDPSQHALHEMRMLIDDMYNEIRHPFFRDCTNGTDLAQRLWKVFQFNGYLPRGVPFPWRKFSDVTSSDLKRFVRQSYQGAQPKDRRHWKARKTQTLIDAYQAVPESIMVKLQNLYQYDFQMFGYNPVPTSLYRKREILAKDGGRQ